MSESPEVTGQYRCPACGNTQRFTGIDPRGYGGRDACEGAAELAPGQAYHCPANPSTTDDACECQTELTQDFDVTEQGATQDDAVIHYHAFTGGEYGAEIGSYTRILCRDCGATVWSEDEGDEETLPAGTDWPADESHRMAQAMEMKR